MYQIIIKGIQIILNEGLLSFAKKSINYFKIKIKNLPILNKIKFKLKIVRYALPGFSALNREKREIKIIVSLTTYPARINAVIIVLGILLRQTCKPDKILLHLSKEQFPERKIPILLRLQKIYGVEILYCDDLKPHKKYFYSMQKYPDDLVITVDDDMYYERDLIENLYKSYKNHPNAVSAFRTHLITFNKEDHINPYKNWKWECSEIVNHPSMRLFATGGSGVLYPPNCMHNELFNEDKIKSLCLKADDLWLKVMQIMNNTPVVLVKENQALNYIEGTQDENMLGCYNVIENKNDDQLNKILDAYNKYFGESDTLIKRLKEGN